MTQAASLWVPPDGATTHTGGPVTPDFVFFAPPPPEIGEVVTAFSVWRGSHRGGQTIASLVMIVTAGAVLGTFSAGVVWWESQNLAISIIAGLLVTALVAYAMLRYERQEVAVTYTGALGIARYVWSEAAITQDKGKVFVFSRAAELRTNLTRHFVNGAPISTTYTFTWTAPGSGILFRLASQCKFVLGALKESDEYHFVRAAELAWSRYLLSAVNEELGRNSLFRFNLLGSNYVEVGPGYLELFMNGRRDKCLVNEIASVDLNQGVITIRRSDSKEGLLGIGSSGIFQFNYSHMSNGRVFLMLLEKLVGVGLSFA